MMLQAVAYAQPPAHMYSHQDAVHKSLDCTDCLADALLKPCSTHWMQSSAAPASQNNSQLELVNAGLDAAESAAAAAALMHKRL